MQEDQPAEVETLPTTSDLETAPTTSGLSKESQVEAKQRLAIEEPVMEAESDLIAAKAHPDLVKYFRMLKMVTKTYSKFSLRKVLTTNFREFLSQQ